MVTGVGRLIEAAIRLRDARIARGATNTHAEWTAATPAVHEASQRIQEVVLEIDVIDGLTHLDDCPTAS